MSPAPAPSGCKGRVGVVARVDQVHAWPPGRLVVVLEPAGLLTTLVGSLTPVFSWLCHVLGDPLQIDGNARRTAYIPDACLTPISQVTDDQIRQVRCHHAVRDLDRESAYLSGVVGGMDDPAAAFTRAAARGALRRDIEHCLEHVATETALREVGFQPIQPGRDVLRWAAVHDGVELRFYADQDLCGDWWLRTRGQSIREMFCDEARLPGEGERGRLLRQVLGLWRSAFGRAPAPDVLALAITYARHQAAIDRAVRPPRLVVDPQAFRAVRRWLVDRFGHLERTQPVRLSFVESLLRIEVDGMAYGCPAHGVWADGCEVDLGDLLDLDASVLRRRSLTLDLRPTELEVNGCALRAAIGRERRTT